jgi:hypothetical protein
MPKKKEESDQDLFGFRKTDMNPLGKMADSYLKELRRRSAESRTYKSYQLTGLEIANILEDWDHKSLYMKLAKKHGEAKMMELAKNVAEKKNIDNKGAYFMSIMKSEKDGLPKQTNDKYRNNRK